MQGKKTGSRTVAIIQARMSSTRLPGKVMMPVMGKPLLGYIVERVRPANRVNRIVVATSKEASDDPIAHWCNSAGVPVVRGELEDVLGRYYQAAVSLDTCVETVVRLTADCPLHHHAVVDFAVEQFQRRHVDYFSNSFPPDFEDGFDVEVFTIAALEKAYREASEANDREHVTPYIRRSPQFTRAFAKYRDAYRYKLSVDSAEDFVRVRRILEALYPKERLFSMDDVIRFLAANPELSKPYGQDPGPETKQTFLSG